MDVLEVGLVYKNDKLLETGYSKIIYSDCILKCKPMIESVVKPYKFKAIKEIAENISSEGNNKEFLIPFVFERQFCNTTTMKRNDEYHFFLKYQKNLK